MRGCALCRGSHATISFPTRTTCQSMHRGNLGAYLLGLLPDNKLSWCHSILGNWRSLKWETRTGRPKAGKNETQSVRDTCKQHQRQIRSCASGGMSEWTSSRGSLQLPNKLNEHILAAALTNRAEHKTRRCSVHMEVCSGRFRPRDTASVVYSSVLSLLNRFS